MIRVERHALIAILLGLVFGVVNWNIPLMHKLISTDGGYRAQIEILQTIGATTLWLAITGAVVWWGLEHHDRPSVGAIYGTCFLSATMIGYYFSYLANIATGGVRLSADPPPSGLFGQLRLMIETRAWQLVGPEFAFYALAAVILGPIVGFGVGYLYIHQKPVN